jgi:sulfate adenylyltransferase
LTGFLGHDDYYHVVHDLHLSDGSPWSIPLTLPVPQEVYDNTHAGQRVALCAEGYESQPLAILTVAEKFIRDLSEEARFVYQTTDPAHPGVSVLQRQGPCLLAGPVTVLRRQVDPAFIRYALTPAETRKIFAERGWQTIVGFQTRNPIHRAHEYLQKVALEIIDGLLIHPLIGETKEDDVPATVRLRCYEVLIQNYYPLDRVVLGVMPAAMRYAGPREAIFHALIRRNYGCTHFIVGRDHAGVGNYYGTYDAQHIFDEFRPGELGIIPLKFEHSFYCQKCSSMASTRTCPHDHTAHLILSGTKVRELLRSGGNLPVEFTRPEVAEVLRAAYQGTTTA